ncbi:TetR/AcrR family transcriptional regulator [Paenibacillus marinisediminis]
MKEKEKLIIETAMKLFAQKGVMATSIQEIATECGISKGAFYLYFPSKEALLLAILQHYSHRIEERVMEVEAMGLPIREQFQRQIEVQLDEIKHHKDFIIMHSREFAIPFNQDIAVFVHRLRADTNQFYRTNLLKVYGENITPYVHDLTLMINGMMSACFELILFDKGDLNMQHMTAYIMNRMDSLVEGLCRSKEEPLLMNDVWMDMHCLNGAATEQGDTSAILLKLVEQAIDSAVHKSASEHLVMTLELLQHEMEADKPRLPLIEGMLHNLGAYPQLHALRDHIRTYYQLN